MRPPHEAGEVANAIIRTSTSSCTFNEAPARGGGGPAFWQTLGILESILQ